MRKFLFKYFALSLVYFIGSKWSPNITGKQLGNGKREKGYGLIGSVFYFLKNRNKLN